MNVKEAFNTVIDVLKTECDKHQNCSNCIYDDACEAFGNVPHEYVIPFRDAYLNSEKLKDKICAKKKLVNNPYFNRVMALPGDNVICLDNGGSYTTYKDFFKYNHREDLLNKYKGWPLTVGKIYEVIDIYPHTDKTCNVYILKEKYNDNVVYLCTDDTDYIKCITDKCKWTGTSKQRVTEILFDVGHLDEYNFMFVDGGYLLLTHSNDFGYNTKLIPNVPKMSSKDIKKKISSYVKYIGGYVC